MEFSNNNSGRVPHVPPDFLWSLVALANFMRLSVQKAAHANLFGAAYRKSGSPVFLVPGSLVRTWGTRPGGKAWRQAGKAGGERTANRQTELKSFLFSLAIGESTAPKDKGEGGGFYWEPSDRMDGTKPQVPTLRSGRDDKLV